MTYQVPAETTPGIIDLRVTYSDTDAMGVVYYANYLRYFEIGRGELMRALGHTYRQVEDGGLLLPVTEASCSYRKPARYDDLLRLETRVTRARGARVCFAYTLRREPDEILVTGVTEHAVVSAVGRPTRLPEGLRALLTPAEG